MNGNIDKCVECIYFTWRDTITDAEIRNRPYDTPDGYCHKIFPRGYVGAGKPGGNVFHGKMKCFQFEPKPEDQISLFDQEEKR